MKPKFVQLSLLLTLAAGALQGQTPREGDLAGAEEAASRGIRIDRLSEALARVLDQGLRDRAFPGAYAIVGSGRGVVAQYGAGSLDWAPSAAVSDSTLWDLASLTKVIALTSSVMQLAAAGTLDLSAPVSKYIPEFAEGAGGKERVRVRDLLTHSSGLPSWRPLYKETESRAQAISLVVRTPLERQPGTAMVYSDLGAILLGEIVQRLSGEPLDRYTAKHLFGPLGMTETGFLPAPSLRSRIAPTERDPWRGRHLLGEVHDENAARLGGVSAHAGLFSSARDLARFARMYLNHGKLDGAAILDSATIEQFTSIQDRTLSTRGLGWETANGSNSGGQHLSPRGFGHTGFTGTSIWIDPGRDLFIILLTNRVNPTRENRKISGVRTGLANAVAPLFPLRDAQRGLEEARGNFGRR